MYERTKAAKVKFFLLFGAPALAVFIAVVLIPFFYGLYLTFTNWDGVSAAHEFVFFDNFVKAFTDVGFWNSLWLTVKYVLFSVLLFGGLFGFLGMVLGVPVFAMFYSAVSRLVRRGLKRRGLPLDTEEYIGRTGPLSKRLTEHPSEEKQKKEKSNQGQPD